MFLKDKFLVAMCNIQSGNRNESVLYIIGESSTYNESSITN